MTASELKDLSDRKLRKIVSRHLKSSGLYKILNDKNNLLPSTGKDYKAEIDTWKILSPIFNVVKNGAKGYNLIFNNQVGVINQWVSLVDLEQYISKFMHFVELIAEDLNVTNCKKSTERYVRTLRFFVKVNQRLSTLNSSKIFNFYNMNFHFSHPEAISFIFSVEDTKQPIKVTALVANDYVIGGDIEALENWLDNNEHINLYNSALLKSHYLSFDQKKKMVNVKFVLSNIGSKYISIDDEKEEEIYNAFFQKITSEIHEDITKVVTESIYVNTGDYVTSASVLRFRNKYFSCYGFSNTLIVSHSLKKVCSKLSSLQYRGSNHPI